MDIRFVYFLVCVGLVQCELINMKCNRIKKFVDGHNMRRLQLAKGSISGQPAASKMNSIIWDAELAAKASKWASKTKYQHNPDKTISSQRFRAGENIYQYGTTDQDLGDFELVEAAMESWFDEHSDFLYKKLEPIDFGTGQPIGHYTQMAWSNSIYLGCGISHSKKNHWNYYLVVCNYGPSGNAIGEAPYKKGKPSGRLTCGTGDCSRKYGDSC